MTQEADLLASGELLEQLRRATLGEYDVHSEIARGGMAAVFLAHEIALDRKVAIKVMSPGLVFGPGMAERFKREARTAAALSHPNIIPVYTVRESHGLCYFVMKLVHGTTLDTVVHQLGRAPIPMVEAVLAQAGGALGYAHRHGVVHRDVKPGNILIDDEGWVVVTDFGIAKVLEAEGLTLTGMSVGTPAYMSPEQGVGGEIGPASDQYSLGVIGYEMLTGQRPFTGHTSMALMYAHANTPPAPIGALRPDCPARLQSAVMRMLAKDPAERWPSMEDAVRAVGGPGLNTDDPTRSKLVELAKTGSLAKMVARAQTPRSPVPIARSLKPPGTSGDVANGAGRSRWGVAVAGVAIAVGLVVATYLLARPSPGPSQPAPTPTAAAVVTPPPPPTVVSTAPVPAVSASKSRKPTTASGAASPQVLAPPAPRLPATATAEPKPVERVDRPAVAETTSVGRISPAALSSPAAVAPAPASVPTADDPRRDIESVLRQYGEALESHDVARVKRAYPGITATQMEGLTAFYSAGGRFATTWTFEDLLVTGDAATARIVGTNQVSVPRTRATQEPVDLRVRLERQSGIWRLIRVGN